MCQPLCFKVQFGKVKRKINLIYKKIMWFIPKRKVIGSIGETGIPGILIMEFVSRLIVIIAMLDTFAT